MAVMKQIFVFGALILALIVFSEGDPRIPERFISPQLSIEEYDEGRIDPPISPGNISDLRYFLWTRSNPTDDEYQVLEPFDLENLTNSNFDGNLPLFFLNAGWTDDGVTYWIVEGKDELLGMMDCNVISCDWGLVEPGPFQYYYDDVQTMYEVANISAGLLDWLIEETPLTPDRIELVGHSLGAHAIGMTALYMTSGPLPRLTGLDPAGPLFYNKTAETRLDKSQADFVDIIHSNGGPATDSCYGIGQSLGHVDFFPNGGVHMPLCANESADGHHIIDGITGCSHQKAVQYWVETVAYARDPLGKDDFLAWPCSDYEAFKIGECTDCGDGCSSMGFNTDRSKQGAYYLRTHGRSPYAMGNDQGNK